MGASSRQERAFQTYLALGPSRSLAALHNNLASDPQPSGFRRCPSLRTLETWSASYHWQDRIAALDRKAREQAEREHLEWVGQYRERLRKEGLLLQQRGIAWVADRDDADVSAHEAIRAIEVGFRLEALSLGEATERVTMEVDDERLQRLTDDELEFFIRQAREAGRGGPTREGTEGSG